MGGLFGFLCYMQVGGGLSGFPYYMHDGGAYLGFSAMYRMGRRALWVSLLHSMWTGGLFGLSLLHAGWAGRLSGFLCCVQNGQEGYLSFSATCMIRGELSGFMCYMQGGGGISEFPGYMRCDQILMGGSCENSLIFSIFNPSTPFHNIKIIIANHVKLTYI